jgi:mRNA-degrading endonuclease toxin of MazEF toxin-antitoxin module
MAVTPEQVRRGAIVLVRLQNDKSRPAAIIRSDLLAELPYATILPLTSYPLNRDRHRERSEAIQESSGVL